ncbi:MAG: peptide chain release factor aRF-1 [Candidatus Thermoplasmatota archaeon]|nr:peptide chain release factor aRF-1 [Candidatus Thermoplasmatota archaeon]
MSKLKRLTAKEKYHLKLFLEEIKKFKGRGTQLISLYIPPTKRIDDVSSYLRNEFSESSNIKSKSTKKNVTGAIESILSRLKMWKEVPENGLVFFVGHHDVGANQTHMTHHYIEPPLPITTFLYRCDSDFYLDQLEDMLASEDLYGLIVIDRSEATIGLISGKQIECIHNLPSRVPSKHGKGGQSAQRFERLIEIAAHDFFKKVGERVDQAFGELDGLKGILVGGPGSTKNYFIRKDFIHHELRKKVIDTFDTGYTNDFGLKELAGNAAKTIEKIELFREKRLMENFFKEIRKDHGGLSTYGIDSVRNAILVGALNTLLISEGIRKDIVNCTCETDGTTIDMIIDKDIELEKKCPECGDNMIISEKRDLVEDMNAMAESMGTEVEMISSASEEGDMLMRAFGGVAGILRYRVNT